MSTTEASLNVDILPFAAPSPVPTDRRVIMSFSPEILAQIVSNGMGLDLCASDSGPDVMWAEVTRPMKAAKANV